MIKNMQIRHIMIIKKDNDRGNQQIFLYIMRAQLNLIDMIRKPSI